MVAIPWIVLCLVGFGIAFGKIDPGKKDVEKRGERWRPFRTMASWYLWRATDSLGDA